MNSLETDLNKIEELHKKDMAAAKSGDINMLITLWTEDGVLLQPGQTPIIGKKAIWKYLQREVSKSKDYEIIEYVHHFQEIEILNEWAYEWGTFSGKVKMNDSDDIISSRARLFRILKKQLDGTWKCARAIWHELPSD